MTIVQFVNNDRVIYGLGDDSRIYVWNYEEADWDLLQLNSDGDIKEPTR